MVSHLKPNIYFRFFPSEPRCVKVTCLPPPFHTSSLSSPDIRAAAFSNIVTVRWGDKTEWEHCQHFNTCHHSCHTIYCLLNSSEINKETVIKTSANTEVKWIHQTVYIHMSHEQQNVVTSLKFMIKSDLSKTSIGWVLLLHQFQLPSPYNSRRSCWMGQSNLR